MNVHHRSSRHHRRQIGRLSREYRASASFGRFPCLPVSQRAGAAGSGGVGVDVTRSRTGVMRKKDVPGAHVRDGEHSPLHRNGDGMNSTLWATRGPGFGERRLELILPFERRGAIGCALLFRRGCLRTIDRAAASTRAPGSKRVAWRCGKRRRLGAGRAEPRVFLMLPSSEAAEVAGGNPFNLHLPDLAQSQRTVCQSRQHLNSPAWAPQMRGDCMPATRRISDLNERRRLHFETVWPSRTDNS